MSNVNPATPAMTADQPVPPVSGLTPEQQRKAKRRAVWTRWAGILVGLAAAIRVGVALLPHGLADCDGGDLQSSLRSAIEASSKLKLTAVTDIKTLSRSDKSAVCSMRVSASDGSQSLLTYQLDLVKGQTNFRVTDVK